MNSDVRENDRMTRCTLSLTMICGILGCLCYGGGDWLMMYAGGTSTSSLF